MAPQMGMRTSNACQGWSQEHGSFRYGGGGAGQECGGCGGVWRGVDRFVWEGGGGHNFIVLVWQNTRSVATKYSTPNTVYMC